MKKMISKYFWDLNNKALVETVSILKNPQHSKFPMRMVNFLSRCQKPKELFSVLNKAEFINAWPVIFSYWKKIEKKSDFRDWWQTIYEGSLPAGKTAARINADYSSQFSNIGNCIRKKRLDQGMSQKELAIKLGMIQPHISRIEEGKMNITLATLMRISKFLGIKGFSLNFSVK
jgi:DNA-binding Xre family transcriptional regulator